MNDRVLILADDFTGGNAAAAGLASVGYRAITVLAGQLSTFETIPARFDAIIVSTATRHSSDSDASAKVRDVLGRSGRPSTVSLRIDSTLRGPIGASAHAALSALRESTGRRAVAICVPAHPDAGRHTISGRQLLDGVDIARTELAREALDPISSSSVLEAMAFIGQSCGLITLDIVTGDEGKLLSTLTDMVTTHDVVVVDASAPEHLAAIAQATTELPAEIEILAVDAGPFSVARAKSGRQRADSLVKRKAPILAVIGSPTELTIAQLHRLKSERSTYTIEIAFDHSGRLRDDQSGLTILARTERNGTEHEIVVVTAVVEGERAVPITVDAAARIVQSLAKKASELMATHPIGGVFCTGGDMTEALLASFGANGVCAEDEVAPLAVSGTISGGPWGGSPLVTKGGMVGDSDSILRCIAKLEGRIAEYQATLPPIVVSELNRVEESHD